MRLFFLFERRNETMKYYIGESGSAGLYFDTFGEFVKVLKDLSGTYEEENEEVF